MTNYDKVIDAVTQQLWEYHTNTVIWDEQNAHETSHKILEIVEQFQQTRSVKQWRASD